MTTCEHEDGITYGKTVYKTPLIHVMQVRCDECHAYGNVVEIWNEDDNQYNQESETWA